MSEPATASGSGIRPSLHLDSAITLPASRPGQGNHSREATADEVDRYNTLEVRLAYRHVYFKPIGGLAQLVRSLFRAEAA